MSASTIEIEKLAELCERSLERSRRRRLAAEEWRRTRFRRHGGTASVAATGMLVAVGGGVAVGSGSDGADSGPTEGAASGSSDDRQAGDLRVARETVARASADRRFAAAIEATLMLSRHAEGRVDDVIGAAALAALRPSPAPVEPTPAEAAPVQQSLGQREAPRRAEPAAKVDSRPVRARRSTAGVEKARAPRGNGSSGSSGVSPALQQIAQCESGGNPGAIGGGGEYRGKYQFTRETWQALGGRGDPAKAPEAEQDRRAGQLYAQSGSSSWPSCGG